MARVGPASQNPLLLRLFVDPSEFDVLERCQRPVFVFDPDEYAMVWANASGLRLWSADSLEEVQKRDFTSSSVESLVFVQKLRDHISEHGSVCTSWTFYPHGKAVHAEILNSPISTRDGRVLIFAEASTMDEESEQLRVARWKRWTEILRRIHFPIFLFDEDAHLLVANTAAGELRPDMCLFTHAFECIPTVLPHKSSRRGNIISVSESGSISISERDDPVEDSVNVCCVQSSVESSSPTSTSRSSVSASEVFSHICDQERASSFFHTIFVERSDCTLQAVLVNLPSGNQRLHRLSARILNDPASQDNKKMIMVSEEDVTDYFSNLSFLEATDRIMSLVQTAIAVVHVSYNLCHSLPSDFHQLADEPGHLRSFEDALRIATSMNFSSLEIKGSIRIEKCNSLFESLTGYESDLARNMKLFDVIETGCHKNVFAAILFACKGSKSGSCSVDAFVIPRYSTIDEMIPCRLSVSAVGSLDSHDEFPSQRCWSLLGCHIIVEFRDLSEEIKQRVELSKAVDLTRVLRTAMHRANEGIVVVRRKLSGSSKSSKIRNGCEKYDEPYSVSPYSCTAGSNASPGSSFPSILTASPSHRDTCEFFLGTRYHRGSLEETRTLSEGVSLVEELPSASGRTFLSVHSPSDSGSSSTCSTNTEQEMQFQVLFSNRSFRTAFVSSKVKDSIQHEHEEFVDLFSIIDSNTIDSIVLEKLRCMLLSDSPDHIEITIHDRTYLWSISPMSRLKDESTNDRLSSFGSCMDKEQWSNNGDLSHFPCLPDLRIGEHISESIDHVNARTSVKRSSLRRSSLDAILTSKSRINRLPDICLFQPYSSENGSLSWQSRRHTIPGTASHQSSPKSHSFGVQNGTEEHPPLPFSLLSRSGSSRIELSLFSIDSDFVIVITDITERKRYEADLGRMVFEAQQAASAKMTFLSTMSHEIRTPLNSILGMSSVLEESSLDIIQRDCLNSIVLGGNVLLGIINDILDLSKIESGCFDVDWKELLPFACAEEAVDIVYPNALQNKVDISTKFLSRSCFETCLGDAKRLRQCLLNFLSNAIKFTEEGSVEVRLNFFHSSIEISAILDSANHFFQEADLGGVPKSWGKEFDGTHNFVHFEVRDSGSGIPTSSFRYLFRNFSQLDSSATRKHGGSGLGLSITQQLVKYMNGITWVESELGRGSSFHILLCLPRAVQCLERPQMDALLSSLEPHFANFGLCIIGGASGLVSSVTSLCNCFRISVHSVPVVEFFSSTESFSSSIDILRQANSAIKYVVFLVDVLSRNFATMNEFLQQLRLNDSLSDYFQNIRIVFVPVIPKVGFFDMESVKRDGHISLSMPVTVSSFLDVLQRVIDSFSIFETRLEPIQLPVPSLTSSARPLVVHNDSCDTVFHPPFAKSFFEFYYNPDHEVACENFSVIKTVSAPAFVTQSENLSQETSSDLVPSLVSDLVKNSSEPIVESACSPVTFDVRQEEWKRSFTSSFQTALLQDMLEFESERLNIDDSSLFAVGCSGGMSIAGRTAQKSFPDPSRTSARLFDHQISVKASRNILPFENNPHSALSIISVPGKLPRRFSEAVQPPIFPRKRLMSGENIELPSYLSRRPSLSSNSSSQSSDKSALSPQLSGYRSPDSGSASLEIHSSSGSQLEPNVLTPRKVLPPLHTIVALILEDNKMNQKVMVRLLSLLGINQTVVFPNPSDALSWLRSGKNERPVSIAFVDLNMPIMDGISFLSIISTDEDLSSVSSGCIFVCVTADARSETRDACIAAGFDYFLPKPVIKEHLVECFHSFVSS